MKMTNPLYSQVFLSFILAIVMVILTFALSKKSLSSTAKSSPFECGFWPHQNSRSPFSLQFFLIALVFLVFDVEIILLFPLLLSTMGALGLSAHSMALFIFVVLGGLWYEWSQLSLEWAK